MMGLKPSENENVAGRRSTGFLQACQGGKLIPFESQGALSSWFQRKLDVVME